MLYLDILQVNAYSQGGLVYSGSYNVTLYPNAVEGSSWSDVTSFNATIALGGSYTGTSSSGYDHGSSTISGHASDSSISLNGSYNNYKQCFNFDGVIPLYFVGGSISLFSDYIAFNCYNLQMSANLGAINSPYVTLDDGSVKTISVYKKKDNLIWFNGSDNVLAMYGLAHFNWTYYTESDSVQPINVTINFSVNYDYYDISEDVYSSNATPVTDLELIESSKAIEESVTSDSGGGLLATIKSWFGSFFDNLIGVFVPEDGYFSDWFDKVNTLLSEKLGMLYAPFDLLISTLQAIYDSDDTENGIPFPGIKWDDSWILEPTTFYFSSLGDSEGVTKLRDAVYFGTDVVLLFSFLFLLEKKIKHILED